MQQSILEILTDEENDANIFLEDDEGNEVEFEQIATIPIGEEIYCILCQVNDGVPEEEGYVFRWHNTPEGEALVAADDDTVQKVFDIYYRMCED